MNYNKIKHLAAKKNISIAELCRKAGITDAGFYQMIPKNRMKISTLEKIADVLKVSPSYFFDGESGYDSSKYEVKKQTIESTEDLKELIIVLKNSMKKKTDLIVDMIKDIERIEENLEKKKSKPDAA